MTKNEFGVVRVSTRDGRFVVNVKAFQSRRQAERYVDRLSPIAPDGYRYEIRTRDNYKGVYRDSDRPYKVRQWLDDTGVYACEGPGEKQRFRDLEAFHYLSEAIAYKVYLNDVINAKGIFIFDVDNACSVR